VKSLDRLGCTGLQNLSIHQPSLARIGCGDSSLPGFGAKWLNSQFHSGYCWQLMFAFFLCSAAWLIFWACLISLLLLRRWHRPSALLLLDR